MYIIEHNDFASQVPFFLKNVGWPTFGYMRQYSATHYIFFSLAGFYKDAP
jgi:hypothetical protein